MTLQTLISFYTQGEVKKIAGNVSSACGCTHYICGNFFSFLAVLFQFLVRRECEWRRNRTVITFSNVNILSSWFYGCLPSYAVRLSFLNMTLCLLIRFVSVLVGCRSAVKLPMLSESGMVSLEGDRKQAVNLNRVWTVWLLLVHSWAQMSHLTPPHQTCPSSMRVGTWS